LSIENALVAAPIAKVTDAGSIVSPLALHEPIQLCVKHL